jgi:HemY protein
MIRILFFVAVILALGLCFAWLADRPGEMILIWQGQRVEMSLIAGITGFFLALAAIVFLLWLVRTLFSSPHRVSRYLQNRRRDKGYNALSRGLIAAGAGDAALAKKMSRRTRTLIDADKEPLIHVLEAQTYMIEGRHDDARAKFEAMSEKPETRALGLRGLYLEARRLGASEAAQQFAERAVEKDPQLSWAGQAALEYRTKDGQWDDAIRLLDKQRQARTIERSEADRKRAVLLTARAMNVLESDPRRAASDAQEALRLAPTLVPAAVVAAKALFRQNDLRRGSRILEKSWKHSPHPEVGATYVRARVGDSVQDRLKRARKLEALKPNHLESLTLVGRAALDAHDHTLARQRAEAALRISPREGLYLLLADIEEADTGDQGRVRHWMAQALRAPRDPSWTAEGYVSEQWAPLSPVTGKLDAFVWKVPVEQLSGPELEAQTYSVKDAELALQTVPPVAKSEPTAPIQPSRATAEQKPAEASAPKAAPAPAPSKVEAAKPLEQRVADDTERGEPLSETAAPKPASPEKNPADSGAVIIPLQSTKDTSSKRDDVVAAAPVAEASTPTPAADQKASGSTPWFRRKPVVSEPTGRAIGEPAEKLPEAKPAPRGEASSDPSAPADRAQTAASTPQATSRPVIVESAATTHGTAEPATSRPPAPPRPRVVETTDAAKSEKEREERFLTQRIDDPGVRKGEASEQRSKSQSSRFRLF